MNDEFATINKIRKLFNKLQNTIIRFKKLEFTNTHLCFEVYRNHIEILSLTSDDNILKC